MVETVLKKLDTPMLCDYICTEPDHDLRALGIEEYLRRVTDGTDDGPSVEYPPRPRLWESKPSATGTLFDVPNPKPYQAVVGAGLYMPVVSAYSPGPRVFKHTRFVRLVNSSPEPDGSYKIYYIKVPPYINDARGAVAWTFGVHNHGYNPVVET